MTEAEWFACTDPDRMMPLLKQSDRASERKLRLHLAAICRFLRQRIRDERSRQAVRTAEDFADGLADQRQLAEASQRAQHVLIEDTLRRSRGSTLQAVWLACAVAGKATELFPTRVPLDRQVRVSLVHEVFGRRPFRSVSIDSALIGGTVVKLAQATYEDRDSHTGLLDNARLSILADALEEVGCTDSDLLSHFRGSGPHVRGCWALDAALGKS